MVYIWGMKKYEEYLNSPYKTIGIEERNFMTKDGETLTMDPETGEYYIMRKISKDKRVLHDELVYTKLFHDSIVPLMSLSSPALKVMMYGMLTVRPLQEIVILNVPDIAVTCGLANSTVYNSIYELLDRKFISKKLGSSIEYWFDHNVFFNGNRLRIYKQF